MLFAIDMVKPDTIIPAHTLATWLLDNIDHLLDSMGLHRYHTLEEVIYFIIIVAVAYLLGWLAKRIILFGTRKLVKFDHTQAGSELLRQHTFTKCSEAIPPLVFLSLAPFAFDGKSFVLTVIIRASVVYLCCALAVGINAIVKYIFSRYNDKENTRNLPTQGILNVMEGIVWLVAVIVSISVIVDKSPMALLGGLTAFAAVLMLIFKDSILGLVAGVQMAQNDMLHVGDWIVVPNTPANGVVEYVSLTTVKVRNFDNTLVMVPPYTLVSTSFQNWRGMSDSGVRRIAENIYINPLSVVRPTAEQLQAYGEASAEVKAFIEKMQASNSLVAWDSGLTPPNGTIETNLGIYRYYLSQYLISSPMISKNFDLMTRVMPMSDSGIPIQLYCFAVTTQWESYEAVLSAVMEHAVAFAPMFGLEVLSGDYMSISQSKPEE